MKEKGSAAYMQCSIRKKLEDYSLDLEKHIVASTHDGAAVMLLHHRADIPVESQLCFNHAIHLTIVDVVYAKKNTTTHFENIDESERDYDDEDGELEESFELEIDEELELKTEFHVVTNRIITILFVLFLNSIKHNDIYKKIVFIQ